MSTEVKYLGIHIVASKCFKCSVDHVKLKFYRVFNSIYAKSQRSETVTVELMKSYCIPFILYATEALCLPKGILNMLNNYQQGKCVKFLMYVRAIVLYHCGTFCIFRSSRLILKSEEVNLYTDYCQLISLLYYLKYKPWTCCINLYVVCVYVSVCVLLLISLCCY